MTSRDLRIRRITVRNYRYTHPNLGYDYNGFNEVFQRGGTVQRTGHVLTIETESGITGEYVGGSAVGYVQVAMVAPYLISRSALERERIWNDLKRALRKTDRFGIGPIDNALWDIAGKVYDAPVAELLGGYRTRIPAYASTYHGDDNGGLDSPEAFADFAVVCREMGFPAFKMHGWGAGPISREVATVRALRDAVGPDMDLMLDPACEYNTFVDALRVGRACDEANFLWLEDPFKDGGQSAFAHRKLRELIRTPIMLGEHVRGMELHVDQAIAGGTDFIRPDSDYDGGITGVMKLAHAAEGLGLDCEIHAPGPAHRHCIAAIRNTNYYELGLVGPGIDGPSLHCPIFTDYSDDLDAIDAEGCVPVPTGAGLGVTINWDWLDANTTETVVLA
ncbi:MAG: mandelate racemase/muconate lactonizing enzyme family protein [uncultured Propionibacteriaceae bacterium]|uniref:glucarate dehydratase n=1 Tax=uncultured Propionibacteriaceae bacterium TaxID=257457 RepID=A0A6J4NBN0_9ACTN|nr:MAG: mandelate racemase/muconate lactonizing enzyme family protein [uncultured Propionibacteriaceae bacterium]